MKNESNTNEAQGPLFAIQRIYVKDISFEAPNSPKMFLEDWDPELNMDLDTKADELDLTTREVVLKVTVTVKIKDQVAFLAEVQQAGIFGMQGFEGDQLRHLLGSFCPNILYPYAREAITDLVTRGGFPPLYLSPINFDMLFEQHEQSRQAGEGTLQ